MRILITNDDGVRAPGIEALAIATGKWAQAAGHEVFVVAPLENMSGASAAVGDVYAMEELAYERHEIAGAPMVEAYGLAAAPALCVITAVRGGFGPPPDLVLSGINLGVNVGRSVLHSGTVGAVLTAAQLGLSGLAVSLQASNGYPFATAADAAVALLPALLAAPGLSTWNLNVPAAAPAELKGIRSGRISTAGIIKDAGLPGHPSPSESKGSISLRLGSAVPSLGDTSDEAADDDGALVAANYASLTAVRGVAENLDPIAQKAVNDAIAHFSGLLGS
ncbi:MAG: 5'/3'-nucleotidase SurE [Actinobacteria bacterium]|nr:5'/3'-nucleotidase SurE [Actinomycetota bacterium]